MRTELLNPYRWRKWFAWYPVMVETSNGSYYRVWLEVIERSWVAVGVSNTGLGSGNIYDYRFL